MQDVSFDQRWPALLAALPASLDLDATAQASGALIRRRAIGDAAVLLRLALAYGPGGLSLRGAAAWAELAGIASLSDVAVLKRLRRSADWLGSIAKALLTARVTALGGAPCRRIRLIAATTLCPPRSTGPVWRLHASYAPSGPGFDDLQLTEQTSGEHLERFSVAAGDLVIADRGLARARGCRHVMAQGGDLVVRMGWQTPTLWTSGDGQRFDVFQAVAALAPGSLVDCDVLVDPRAGVSPLPLRFIARRKTADESRHEQRRIRRRAVKRGRTPQPKSKQAAEYLFLLTSLPRAAYPPERVLALYRLRWQVELAFKRLKSLLHLDRLPAKDRELARSWLYAHLIAALLIDALSQEVLDTPPCAAGDGSAPAVAVARPQAARRLGRRCHPRSRGVHHPARRSRADRPAHLRPTA